MADEAAQWMTDHPDGQISAEEEASMARYADESCREPIADGDLVYCVAHRAMVEAPDFTWAPAS